MGLCALSAPGRARGETAGIEIPSPGNGHAIGHAFTGQGMGHRTLHTNHGLPLNQSWNPFPVKAAGGFVRQADPGIRAVHPFSHNHPSFAARLKTAVAHEPMDPT